jgi:hypothetical protein
MKARGFQVIMMGAVRARATTPRTEQRTYDDSTSQPSQSPFNAAAYYKSVVDKLGQASIDSFMRFYVTPAPTTAAPA